MDVLSYDHEDLLASKNGGSNVDSTDDVDSQCEEEGDDINSEIDEAVTNIEEPTSVATNDVEKVTKPPLRRSLFPHVAPYIAFQSYEVNGPNFPPEISKHLKWRLSTITPLVVRLTLINSGYRLMKKSQEWCGTWGKHMKSVCYKTLKESQKINHFPGTFQIGRKDRLWRNLSRMILKHGKKEFGFIPRTYVLPQDMRMFRQIWEKTGCKEKWIVKPPAAARGTGIRVIHRWSQIPKKRPVIVQQYLSRPMLIGGAKFDLRLYVLVTSVNPLRAYIYPDGLVRFASVKYVDDVNSLSDRFMHLTNYSINKASATYTSNDSADSCTGHKWTIKTLWTYLAKKEQVDVTQLWSTIKDIVIKTLIAGESSINTLTKANISSRYCCYELFGVDILLDENYKPWLLEFNISPSLQTSSPLDIAVKGPLIKNVFNMAAYQLPPSLNGEFAENLAKRYNLDTVCQDYRLHRTSLSYEERHKQSLFVNLTNREDYLEEILETLTPDDVRYLIAYEDELTQIDRFEKIFPSRKSHKYLPFFEGPRYYNMLFDAWEDKYGPDRETGIARLQRLCKTKYHLEQQMLY